MKIRDFFKKTKKDELDPLSDLSLARLKKGYLVDYDLKTWEVSAYNYYDWSEGDISHEWQLKSGDDVVYLEMESDDEKEWSLSRKIAFGRLDSQIKKSINETGDPPEKIVFDGVTYYMEETGGGRFYKDGQGQGREVLQWSYQDDEGQSYFSIEQWGEEEFEASTGEPVKEYQFTNILPR
ncbi:MAG: DUF4178 domain-containing protein [Desulfobacteraceae bacterium]|nr:DUF4178 domain-containing protein [Desulfobacteraceae bacterium]MBC2720759.1 DUF4178 domain-containing protein [Desulfobacteraceae bacterium]